MGPSPTCRAHLPSDQHRGGGVGCHRHDGGRSVGGCGERWAAEPGAPGRPWGPGSTDPSCFRHSPHPHRPRPTPARIATWMGRGWDLTPAQTRGPEPPLSAPTGDLPTLTRLSGVGHEPGDVRTPGWLRVLSPGEGPLGPKLLGSLPREPDQGSSRPRVLPSLEASSPQRECPAPSNPAQGTERET